MDHFVGMLASGSLLGNTLDGSSIEVGSSSNVVLYRDDEDECIEKDDDDNIHNGDETHMQQQLQEQRQQQLVVSHIEEGFYIDDTHNGVEGHQLKRKRRRGPRLWRDKWQKSHPWAFIRNLNGEERMFCTVCEAHGHTTTRNAFRKEGSTNFQQSALATHANSSAHRSALLTQKARAEAGKMGVNGKTRGKASATPEYGIVTNHLTNIANKLSSLVTREDLESLKAELRLMIRCQDARRINASCALNDPLMLVPLSSKHLFYREMCAYHNGNRIHLESDHGLQHPGMMIMHHAARTRDGHDLFRPTIEDTSGGCGGGGDENEEEDIKEEEEDDEDDEDDDNENEGDPEIEGGMEESMKRPRMSTNWEDINLWSSPGSQEFGRPNAQDNFNQELIGVLQDPTKAEWQKRQWMRNRTMQLEEQKVMIQAEAFELEKQRMKWKKFRSRKDRELDKLRLENERMKLENERMALQLKEKELDLELKRSEASMPSVTLKMDRYRGMEQHDMVRGESMQ